MSARARYIAEELSARARQTLMNAYWRDGGRGHEPGWRVSTVGCPGRSELLGKLLLSGYTLTPLGNAVRDILMEKAQAA